MIYFTADLHFFHDNIITHAKRPYSSTNSMNKDLIKRWNERVKGSDDIYILGDITLKGGEMAMQVLSQLNGKKYLIKGNHDGFLTSKHFRPDTFEWVKDYYELKYDNDKFVLFHYPISEWNGFFNGVYHLHGHLHLHAESNFANSTKHFRRYDVGVDANNYAPVSIKEIRHFFNMTEETF